MINELMIKNAKAQSKPYKITDSGGLTLLVQKNGTKYWLMRYRFGGKEKMLGLGTYPNVGLKDARLKRDEIRRDIANNIDPSHKRKIEKISKVISINNSFESIAMEWFDKQKATWVERHAFNIRRRLELNVFPLLAKRPISEITPQELLLAIREVESREKIDTAKRTLQTCGQIFRYAVATGRALRDPCADLKGALKSYKPDNHKYISNKDLPEFFVRLNKYTGSLYTKLALELMLHTFVRTKELRFAEWQEFNLDKAEWVIPAERMKMKELHIVPLSSQSINILNKLSEFKQAGYVFPGSHSPLKPMSENAMLQALYRMGYHGNATVHGFRATASTILNESELFRSDVIERQLAHAERNKIRGAYNHAQYLPERRKMMQWWSDYLETRIKHAGD